MSERVDFYVLASSTPKQRLTFACRLAEKAYSKDLNVVLLTETVADAELLDELLWTFSDRSFVPHVVQRFASTQPSWVQPASPQPAWMHPAPVLLTPDLEPIETADVLVNLSTRLPVRLERFSRIAEIVDADEERRRSGRERFKVYRELELPVETHHMDDTASA